MDNTIDTLVIKVQGDGDSAVGTLDKVIDRLERIKTVGQGRGISSVTSKLNSLRTAINGIKTKNLSRLNSLFSTLSNNRINISSRLPGRITEIGEAVRSLEGTDFTLLNQMADGLSALSRVDNVNLPRINGGSGQNNNAGNNGACFNGTEELTVSDESVARASRFSDRLADINDRFATATSGARSFGAQVKSAFSTTLIGKFSSKVKSLITAFGRIALYRVMRSVIRQVTDAFSTGISDMYQYSKTFSGSFSTSMDRAASSLLSFKNSLAAAITPLIEYLVPYLDKAVDRLMEINNTIAMVIAGLTGKSTYSKAVRTTTEYAAAANSAADSTNKVKDSVEELKRSFAGLDEITVIGDNSSASSSLASAIADATDNGTDYSTMFVEAPVDMAKVNEIKEKLEGIWEIVKLIGLAFAAWELTKILSELGLISKSLSGLTFAGLVLTVTGAVLLIKGIKNVITEGMNWENFWTLFFGAAAITAGTAVLGNVIAKITGNTNWTAIGARVGAGIGGAALLFAGLYDTFTNTIDNKKGDLESTLTSYFSSVIGGALIGTAISPGIGTAIGAVAGAVIDGIAFAVSNPETISKVEDALKNGTLAENVKVGFTYELIKTFNMDTETAASLATWWSNAWVKPVQDVYTWFADIPKRAEVAWLSLKLVWYYAAVWFAVNVTIPIKSFFTDLWDGIVNKVSSAWTLCKLVWVYAYVWFKNNVTDPIEQCFSNLWSGIKSAAATAINWVIGKIESGINNIISGANWFIEKYNAIGQWASNVTGMTFYTVQTIQPVSLGRVQAYQEGGFPEDGLFFANHNELVGQFSNGKTAVANNEQIVEGIRGGVASANEEQNKLLREQNKLLRQLLQKDSTLNVSTISSAFSRQNRRNGKVTVPVGT